VAPRFWSGIFNSENTPPKKKGTSTGGKKVVEKRLENPPPPKKKARALPFVFVLAKNKFGVE
jgi:hypothetical protein